MLWRSGRVVDEEVFAGRVAHEDQRLLVIGDVYLSVGEDQTHDKPRSVRLRRDRFLSQDVVAGEVWVTGDQEVGLATRVILLAGVVEQSARLVALTFAS